MPRRAKTSLDHQKPLVMAMKLDSLLLAVLFIIGIALTNAKKSPVIPSRYSTTSLNRTSFPRGFIFGSASSAYQYEGAWNQGGRKPSIWDNYTHQYPERINGSTTGDVAADQYHRYKEDVGIMKNMGLDAYRLSISWSRVLPNGKLSGGVNQEGIKYYNNLINALLSRGLKPFVTIFHWDLPQALEEEYGGFLSPKIVNHFRDFAEICYKAFGDRVKHWMTLNEPWTYAVNGYAEGAFAPGRCSAWMERNCTGGDSGTEPYLVAHNFLLAHAAAVKLYRYKYQKIQRGVIGMALGVHWFVPVSNSTRHQNAALRSLDFMLGWFMEPLTSGSYPHTMKVLVGKRLPVFTAEQSKLIKGSYDFIGINYYTTHYSSYAPHNNSLNASYLTDARVFQSPLHNGVPIGPPGASSWLYVYPKGLQELLVYTKKNYQNPLIYITENGIDEWNDPTLSLEKSLNDTHRIDYIYQHLDYLNRAIKDGVNVKGYFSWSLLDNFEWSAGYTVRFGLIFVDFNDGQKRHSKLSARWFKNFLKE
ncbi:beta-glucosidase 12-like [Malus sylvestris]|uniref:beta-glucosidase 12-like n=1 Tax=Malus domestica TaxID=3750 RepID=UPI0021ABF1D1|nr:beta-glucosidase 12-like [Malus sylvestris]